MQRDDLALTQAWECPACGCQLAFGEGFTSPPSCSFGHPAREMEQVFLERFGAATDGGDDGDR